MNDRVQLQSNEIAARWFAELKSMRFPDETLGRRTRLPINQKRDLAAEAKAKADAERDATLLRAIKHEVWHDIVSSGLISDL